MYVLTRFVSMYDAPNPFLGLFSTEERANDARRQYIEAVKGGDPWAKQSYRTPDLEQDVRIDAVDDRRTDREQRTAFLVSGHFESHGQSCKKFFAVFSDKPSADEHAARMEEGPFEATPNWCDVDLAIIDEAVVDGGRRRLTLGRRPP
jgi:hypothetical protein